MPRPSAVAADPHEERRGGGSLPAAPHFEDARGSAPYQHHLAHLGGKLRWLPVAPARERFAVGHHRAPSGPLQAPHDLEQGALAGAVGAQQARPDRRRKESGWAPAARAGCRRQNNCSGRQGSRPPPAYAVENDEEDRDAEEFGDDADRQFGREQVARQPVGEQ